MDVETYLANKAELRSVEEKEGAAIMEQVIRDFFKKHPGTVGITWTQGTPSFNDGDPCVFYVNPPMLLSDVDNPDDYWESCEEADLNLGPFEDLCEQVWGEARVTVTQGENGEPVVTSDYWHCGY